MAYIICKLYPSIIRYVFIQSLFAIDLQDKNTRQSSMFMSLPVQSADGILKVATIQMRGTRHYLRVLTFEIVEETLVCEQSNKSC